MNSNVNHQRLSRLQRECDMAIGPVLLLAAASVALVIVLGLDALLGETTPAQAAQSSQQAVALRPRLADTQVFNPPSPPTPSPPWPTWRSRRQ